MSREEFDRTVKKMQDEGVPLTMANLLVRTELPRSQIEAWLDAGQRDIRFGAPKPEPRRTNGDGGRDDDDSDEEEHGLGDKILATAKSIKGQMVGDVVKSQLGLSDDRDNKQRRALKTGAVLGIALPPAGLIYSAPIPIAVLGTVAYAALFWLAMHIPFFGLYILAAAHLAGGAAGAAYAWRFNRGGKRAALLPKGREDKPKRKRRDGPP